MSHFDPNRAPIDELQLELGKALAAAIDEQGGKVAFAQRAGLNRATLYRLLRGENVSTEILLRTLRALGRGDLLAQLLAPPEPSPLEMHPKGSRNRRKKRAPKQLIAPGLSAGGTDPPLQKLGVPRSPGRGSLVQSLTLGQLPSSLVGGDQKDAFTEARSHEQAKGQDKDG